MTSRRTTPEESSTSRRKPATTPEASENRMILLATQLAEKQLIDGTASAQVVTHYLKLGSSREKLEQEKIKYETQLSQAKADMIASQRVQEELYLNAMRAMRQYNGQDPVDSDD